MSEPELVIHPKRAKGEDGYRIFSIRLKEDMLEEINRIAAQTGYSRNELISRFLEFAIDHCRIAEEKEEMT